VSCKIGNYMSHRCLLIVDGLQEVILGLDSGPTTSKPETTTNHAVPIVALIGANLFQFERSRGKAAQKELE